MFNTHLISNEKLWTHKQKLEALEEITGKQLADFVPRLLGEVYIECYVHGNINRAEAIKMAHQFDPLCDNIPMAAAELTRYRHVKFKPGVSYLFEYHEEVSPDYAIENYLVMGLDDSKGNVLVELMSQIIHEQFSFVLRSTEQLGYVVHSGLRRQHGVNGIRFIIQGGRDAAYLDRRIEVYLDNMAAKIRDMDEVTFAKHVQTLSNKKKEVDKSMSHEVNRHWSEILDQQYNFNRAAVELEVLKTITKEDLMAFYSDKVSPRSANRQKLSTRSLSVKHKERGQLEVK
eukprot:Ihof_evm2s957 gene=Ihof_evmTU2s957